MTNADVTRGSFTDLTGHLFEEVHGVTRCERWGAQGSEGVCVVGNLPWLLDHRGCGERVGGDDFRCVVPAEGEGLDDATLITSELVTNSVQHGHLGAADVFDLTLQRRDRALLIEVTDACQWQLPAPRRSTLDGLGGRGLALIGAPSQGWGLAPRPLGTAVWARLAIGG